MNLYVWLRRCVQLLAALIFCLLPWLNGMGVSWISGSLFALDILGVSFADPVATTQVLAAGEVPGVRLLVGAVCSLALALALGRVFCSWICPYGLLSEMGQKLRHRQIACVPEHNIFIVKTLILSIGLAVTSLLGFSVLGLTSLPGELSLVPVLVWQGSDMWFLLGALALPLVVLALEILSGRRLWCRYVCPQSVLLGIAAKSLPPAMPGLRIRWQAELCSCKGEFPCRAICSLALNPRSRGGPERRDCTQCGDCLKVCALRGGALVWQVIPRQGHERYFGQDDRAQR